MRNRLGLAFLSNRVPLMAQRSLRLGTILCWLVTAAKAKRSGRALRDIGPYQLVIRLASVY